MNHLFLPAPRGHGAWRFSAISAVCAALFLSGCSRQAPVQEPVRAVKLLTVGGSDLNVQGEYAAEVRARVESRLGFRVGRLCRPRCRWRVPANSPPQRGLAKPAAAGVWTSETSARRLAAVSGAEPFDARVGEG